jgi:hypothetical protein
MTHTRARTLRLEHRLAAAHLERLQQQLTHLDNLEWQFGFDGAILDHDAAPFSVVAEPAREDSGGRHWILCAANTSPASRLSPPRNNFHACRACNIESMSTRPSTTAAGAREARPIAVRTRTPCNAQSHRLECDQTLAQQHRHEESVARGTAAETFVKALPNLSVRHRR